MFQNRWRRLEISLFSIFYYLDWPKKALSILAIGYLAEKITNYFGDNFKGMDISYVVEDDPLGTGGAVRLAMTKAKSCLLYTSPSPRDRG